MTERTEPIELGDKLVEGDSAVEYHWWVQAPVNQDAYWVHLVRYTQKNGEYVSQEYFSDGDWHLYQGFDIIKPVMVLDGILVHTLIRGGVIEHERGTIAENLTDLAERIWASVQ